LFAFSIFFSLCDPFWTSSSPFVSIRALQKSFSQLQLFFQEIQECHHEIRPFLFIFRPRDSSAEQKMEMSVGKNKKRILKILDLFHN